MVLEAIFLSAFALKKEGGALIRGGALNTENGNRISFRSTFLESIPYSFLSILFVHIFGSVLPLDFQSFQPTWFNSSQGNQDSSNLLASSSECAF